MNTTEGHPCEGENLEFVNLSYGFLVDERFQVGRKALVEKSARTALAKPLNHRRTRHSQFIQDEPGDKGGTIEAHATMRQHAVSRIDDARTQTAYGVKLLQIRQIFIEDRKVNV